MRLADVGGGYAYAFVQSIRHSFDTRPSQHGNTNTPPGTIITVWVGLPEAPCPAIIRRQKPNIGRGAAQHLPSGRGAWECLPALGLCLGWLATYP